MECEQIKVELRSSSFYIRSSVCSLKSGMLKFVTKCAHQKGTVGRQPPAIQNVENADFVDTISNVLRDLTVSQNQPLKSADI
jgi:hypothetical protein